jgi:tetratricopeptide (TPR) repeat protein
MTKSSANTVQTSPNETASGSPRSQYRRDRIARQVLLGLLLIALTAVAYAPALKGGFIWDDDVHLTQNPCIVGPSGLKEIWTTRAARICPLVQTTFWVEHKIWGLNPLPYHVVNILMHAAGAVALWQVLRSLRIRGAWLGAALWALHPVQVETVAWITELKNTQSCFFYLLAILFFVKSETAQTGENARRSYSLYGLSFVCGALAMASKSSTVVLPVVLGLASWWINKRLEWRAAIKIAPFLLLSAAASLLSIWTQHLEGANEPEYARSTLERIIVAGKVVWFYLQKLAWPHPLVFIYPRWEINASQALSYFPTVAVVAVFLVCWWNRKDKLRPVFLAFTYFLIALFPVLGLLDHFFLRYSFVGDHFQYLASMGPLALAAAGIITAFDFLKKQRRFLEPAFCGALLLVLGVLTWRQCPIYFNAESLWRATLFRNPVCWMALNNIGVLLVEEHRPDEAIAYCERALQVRPDYAEAELSLGNVLLKTQRPDAAISHFNKALHLTFAEGKLGEAKTYYFMGNAFLEKGEPEKATENYQAVLQIQSEYAIDARNNLGEALLRLGRVEEAIDQYQQVVELKSHLPKTEQAKAAYNLANALSQKGRLDDAIRYYDRALQLDPNYADAHNNLARTLIKNRQFHEAIAHYQRAFELTPQSILAENNLAWQLATCPEPALRNGARAIELAEQANQLSSGKNPIILNTLAAAYAENGQFARAIEIAQDALRLVSSGADPGLLDFLRQAIALYQAGAPYHQTPP